MTEDFDGKAYDRWLADQYSRYNDPERADGRRIVIDDAPPDGPDEDDKPTEADPDACPF